MQFLNRPVACFAPTGEPTGHGEFLVGAKHASHSLVEPDEHRMARFARSSSETGALAGEAHGTMLLCSDEVAARVLRPYRRIERAKQA